jgi:translation initiation factor IF-3
VDTALLESAINRQEEEEAEGEDEQEEEQQHQQQATREEKKGSHQEENKEEVKVVYLNNSIPFDRMLVIGADGKGVGELSKAEALKLAEDSRLDLMLLSPIDKPGLATCKIQSYGAYYRKKKKEFELQQKNAQKVEKARVVKTLMVRKEIAINDLMTKVNQAKRFLKKKYLVHFNYPGPGGGKYLDADTTYRPLFGKIIKLLTGYGYPEKEEINENTIVFLPGEPEPITNSTPKQQPNEKPNNNQSIQATLTSSS